MTIYFIRACFGVIVHPCRLIPVVFHVSSRRIGILFPEIRVCFQGSHIRHKSHLDQSAEDGICQDLCFFICGQFLATGFRIAKLDHAIEILLIGFSQLHISAHELQLSLGQVGSLLDILMLVKQLLNTTDHPCARNHILAEIAPAVAGAHSLDIAHAIRQILTQSFRTSAVVLGDHLFAQLKGFLQDPILRLPLRDSRFTKAAGDQHLEAALCFAFCILFTCAQLLSVDLGNKLAGTRHGKIDGSDFLRGQLAVFGQIVSIGRKLLLKRLVRKYKIIGAVLNGVKEVTGRRNRSGTKHVIDKPVCILQSVQLIRRLHGCFAGLFLCLLGFHITGVVIALQRFTETLAQVVQHFYGSLIDLQTAWIPVALDSIRSSLLFCSILTRIDRPLRLHGVHIDFDSPIGGYCKRHFFSMHKVYQLALLCQLIEIFHLLGRGHTAKTLTHSRLEGIPVQNLQSGPVLSSVHPEIACITFIYQFFMKPYFVLFSRHSIASFRFFFVLYHKYLRNRRLVSKNIFLTK